MQRGFQEMGEMQESRQKRMEVNVNEAGAINSFQMFSSL